MEEKIVERNIPNFAWAEHVLFVNDTDNWQLKDLALCIRHPQCPSRTTWCTCIRRTETIAPRAQEITTFLCTLCRSSSTGCKRGGGDPSRYHSSTCEISSNEGSAKVLGDFVTSVSLCQQPRRVSLNSLLLPFKKMRPTPALV
ncbi:unnamed protein product [Chondrus crispus]|uniref:Uncharacterized protein n=1 Tax=Chondrus crispus TaxID=2769 RepID=R7QPW0_CHOCR|nr:unnamed protein product [Chondrus crispus]CDF39823.1 unnamed protein product [Chondrus crispus]|eukprot:XP_005710117.1 unnamed protein product [Chondrus crispus]